MKAFLKQTRISSKKANLVAGIVRRKGVEHALETLKYMPKKAARTLYKLIASATANAENNFGKKRQDLAVDSIVVTEGVTYKRGQSHSKGRITPLKKRTSHITVQLADKAPEQK